jgi:glucosamine kinase
MLAPGPYLLGVDGGGTGCRARVVTVAGDILGEAQAGPATLRLGADIAWASVMAAANAALSVAGIDPARSIVHAGIGLAGTGRTEAFATLQKQPHPFASTSFVSDGFAAFLGAHSGMDGGIVVAGTGSIAIARMDGKDVRIGGYGFPVSDEGGGADIGLQAMRFALRALDGRMDTSPLLDRLLGRFEHQLPAIVAWMDRATATEYAALVPDVLAFASRNDPVATKVMQDAGEQIDDLLRSLYAQNIARVSLVGGLAQPLSPWLAGDVRQRLKPPDGDAVAGAIILARRRLERE